MKNSVILQKLELDPKISISKHIFEFIDNLTYIVGVNGSGKSLVLKIINLLKSDDLKPDDFVFYLTDLNLEHDSCNFKCHLNNRSFEFSIGFKDNTFMVRAEEEIKEILPGIKILYFDRQMILREYLHQGNKLAHFSEDHIQKAIYDITKDIHDSIILFNDTKGFDDPAQEIRLLNYLKELSQQNQVIYATTNLNSISPTKDLRSFISLKDPFQEFLYHFYSKLPKSGIYKEFQKNFQNVEKLLRLKIEIHDNNLENYYLRMLYANIITTMEAYLSDRFIKEVLDNPDCIPKLLEHTFNNKKYTLKDAYDWIENKNENIVETLSKIVFHNLAKIKSMYKNILEIDFPESIDNIFLAVKNRHDIVHRNGKTKDHAELIITKENLKNLIEEVVAFIEHIEKQVKP